MADCKPLATPNWNLRAGGYKLIKDTYVTVSTTPIYHNQFVVKI